MKVILKNYTPLYICSDAIRKCWSSQDNSDSYKLEGDGVLETIVGNKDKALIDSIGNKNKHSSTLEHLVYSFDISGVSRALLQEKARHRIASLSVKSSRYTLKELKSGYDIWLEHYTEFTDLDEEFIFNCKKFIVFTGNDVIDLSSINALSELQYNIRAGISNDIAKYCMPEAYKTEYSWTINARALQNFLELRTNKAALWEIRDLANMIFEAIPNEHKYLFEHCLYKNKKEEVTISKEMYDELLAFKDIELKKQSRH